MTTLRNTTSPTRNRTAAPMRRAGAALAGLTLSLAGAAVAQAEENAVILIDQSGSMLSPGEPPVGAMPGKAKWVLARELATSFLAEPHPDREYALWTFSGTSFNPVVTFGMSKSAAEVKTALDALPMPGGSTPLARSICAAVDDLMAWEPIDFPIPEKRIYLLSDGMENSTPSTDQCDGPSDATVPYAVNSWQWKVYNKARSGNANNPVEPGIAYRVIMDVDALFEYVPTFSAFSASAFAAPAANPTATANLSSAILPPIEQLPVLAPSAPIPITAPLVKAHPGLPFYVKITADTTGRYREIEPGKPLPQLGDVNGDHCVDQADFNVLAATYGQTVPRGHGADQNRDRKVDFFDRLAIVQNMGKGCGRR